MWHALLWSSSKRIWVWRYNKMISLRHIYSNLLTIDSKFWLILESSLYCSHHYFSDGFVLVLADGSISVIDIHFAMLLRMSANLWSLATCTIDSKLTSVSGWLGTKYNRFNNTHEKTMRNLLVGHWCHVKQQQKFCTETLKKVFSNTKKWLQETLSCTFSVRIFSCLCY